MQTNKVGLLVLFLIIILCCIGVCCVAVAGGTLFGINKIDPNSDFSYSFGTQTEVPSNGEGGETRRQYPWMKLLKNQFPRLFSKNWTT
jgi:hypothetical protein